MSDQVRTAEEYIQRHADTYHNGDIERAKEDAIVKEVVKEKQKWLPRMGVVEYLMYIDNRILASKIF